jgi:drug/metabolite transporter (DMT)-like permease
MHPFEVTFFRCLFSLFVMLPFIIRAGPAVLVNRKVGFYTLRAVVGLISMLSWFYGITFVPLATATAVNFTAVYRSLNIAEYRDTLVFLPVSA